MQKVNFNLHTAIVDSIRELPAPAEVHVPVLGCILQIGKGKNVLRGTRVAERPTAQGGDKHAPASGKVNGLNYTHVSIKLDGEEENVDPVDLGSMEPGKGLLRALRGLGIDTGSLVAAETLIINGLNPEPGITAAEQLLRDEQNTLEAGLALASRIIAPKRTVLALAQGYETSLSGCETLPVKPVYPNSLAPLVAKAVTGKENPAETVVLSVMDLYSLGQVAATGLPVRDTILTVNGGLNYRVLIGTPLSEILSHAGIEVEQGDRVVLDGPMRGRAVYSLDDGVNRDTYGVTVVKHDAFPAITDEPCINCGECVLHCPARVMPHMISKYAEFNLFENTEAYGIKACFECGLCSFYCVARRPLLQYIRLAKKELLASKSS
jgi:electron transport complex protein RnfC